MTNIAVSGLQWGDEGKGKVVDYLSDRCDVVARFQGGNNAGHTIISGDKEYKLSLIPSGIIRGKKCIIGCGTVVGIDALIKEIGIVRSAGIEVSPQNLMLSHNATLVLDIHSRLDALSEGISGNVKIGTTKRGIGFAYQDRCARRALRICDIFEDDFMEKVDAVYSFYRGFFEANGQKLPDPSNEIIPDDVKKEIKPLVTDVTNYFYTNSGDAVLLEGAQGILLDINHGTYPFVTSSNTVPFYSMIGSGIAFKDGISKNLGICKSYSTRVGEGPFPTENGHGLGELLQTGGNEFGTVTGRTRRCGPLDLHLLRYAVAVSGVNSMAITKIDVLDTLAEIPVCVGYKGYDGVCLPVNNGWAGVEPIYEILAGWNSKTYGASKVEDLPENAIAYLRFIAQSIGIPITMVSTGPDRAHTIECIIE